MHKIGVNQQQDNFLTVKRSKRKGRFKHLPGFSSGVETILNLASLA